MSEHLNCNRHSHFKLKHDVALSSDGHVIFFAVSTVTSVNANIDDYITTASVASGDFQIYHRILEVTIQFIPM